MSQFAWTPTTRFLEESQLGRFLRQSGEASFEQLHRRSVGDPAWFTAEVLRFLDIRFQAPYREVLRLDRGLEWPEWCVGARLNIAESCLRWPDDWLAVVEEAEDGSIRRLSYGQLRAETLRWSAGLRGLGLGKGDAVGVCLPMTLEAVIALLALARIGAIATPLFSGYGSSAIETRLHDVEAKALISCEGFFRRSKWVETQRSVSEAISRCPSLRHHLVIRRDQLLNWPEGDSSLELTAAEDPLIIIYTSGTTGKPKGILHTHCGFPVKAAQDMAFHMDTGPASRISWITDLGWMMGPWLIYGALILGGTIVLLDGAPDFPDPGRLWSFAARHQVNTLGVSPTLIRTLAGHGASFARGQDLSALKLFGSTGEPWNPDPWWWLFAEVGQRRIPIMNYSGGTECSGGILANHPLAPIKPCGFAAPCPGMAADTVDDQGRPVRQAVGELAIRGPWIGQARGFWRDPERYLQTYWSRIPGMWIHGDWAEIDADGHWFIHGRSDDTLKIAGKRVGPAEVESILVADPQVVEAAVIGVPDARKGSAMVGFCVALQPGEALAARLCDRVAQAMGKPLRPDRIHFVSALPKTRNGKIMRRVVRAAYLGEDPGDLMALENPQAVEQIQQAAAAAVNKEL
ncbi:MAG: AMP-binding protein [Bryobacteraceae bacterium]|nr:AMP-binding protein [Bryobacteraceae bacterium]MDW8377024.1 AMP-binding protein [Bryobacterales bacterium]